MTAAPESQRTLTDEQRARVHALDAAKRTLGASSAFSTAGPAERFDVTDILRVAHFIIAGRNLLDEPNAADDAVEPRRIVCECGHRAGIHGTGGCDVINESDGECTCIRPWFAVVRSGGIA